jgi:hypothetical protein
LIPLKKYNRRALFLCAALVLALGVQSSHALWHHHEQVPVCNHAHETDHHWHSVPENTHDCCLCALSFSSFTLPLSSNVTENIIKSVHLTKPQFIPTIFYNPVYLFSSLRAPPFEF